jgi:hypothetical protein
MTALMISDYGEMPLPNLPELLMLISGIATEDLMF